MSPRAFRHAVPLVLTLAALAAGCGGGQSTGSSDPFGVGARAIPAHPLAFADVNLDRGSAAWTNVEALGTRFPGWSKVTRQVRRELAKPSDGVSIARDVEPYVGDEAAMAVTGVNIADTANPVDVAGFVAVTDDGKIRDALTADGKTKAAGSYHGLALFRDPSSPDMFVAEGDGALLVSNDRATLRSQVDAWKGGASLADDSRFGTAMASLPEDSLVRGYLDARRLASLLSLAALGGQMGGAAPQAAQVQQVAKSLRDAGAVTASFGADANGFRLTMNAMPAPGHSLPKQLATANAAPMLIGDVPQDAFAYVGLPSFGGNALGGGNPAARQQFRALQQLTGLDVVRDVLPLFSGGVAGYAAPGIGMPKAALLLAPKDPAAAAAAMSRLTAFIARQQPGLRFRSLPAHRGQVAMLGPGTAIGWHRTGDVIAVSNDGRAGTAQASSLADSGAFRTLAGDAGMPDTVSGLAYVNIPQIMAAIPAETTSDPNVAHVGGLLVWGSTDDAGAHFTAYLEVTP